MKPSFPRRDGETLGHYEAVWTDSGRELDALVAEKVMGCTLGSFRSKPPYDREACLCPGLEHADPENSFLNRHGGILLEYSTDIAAAWSIVDFIHGENPHDHPNGGGEGPHRFHFEASHGLWECSFADGGPGQGITPEEAICRAALMFVDESRKP